MSSASDAPNDTSPDFVSELLEVLLALLWRFRVELVLLGVVAAGFGLLSKSLGPDPAGALVGVALCMLLVVPATRRVLVECLARAHWRRRLEQALGHVAHDCFADRRPIVGRVRRSAVGVGCELHLRPGSAPSHVERAAEHLACALGVGEVRVERVKHDASVVALHVVTRDPFGGGPIACPWAGAAETSLWSPLPLGEDELGRPVPLTLVERNLLAGGEPGSAKSNLLQQIAAVTALDPEASLWCLDPKVVELARWAGVAAGVAGPDVTEAIGVLQTLADEMATRYSYLKQRRTRKITKEDGLGLHVLLVDEAMIYLTDPDKKVAAEFAALLRSLVALGRAAGIIVVLATQKPATDVLPSSVRDNIAIRCAFRCTTKDHSDTILGAGWATNGVSAADIDVSQPGVCYLLAEGATPKKLRCYHLSDEDLDRIVERAEALRR
jgi:DNA segregation ATPase FtsK/SpoIIIE-like protein